MNLWLVRHARPLIAAGICYGQLDMAADAQATRECAQKLAELLPTGSSVVSSPLQRCEQLTTVLIGHRADLVYKTDPKLKEMDFGDWEGRAWADIAKNELEAWTDNFASYKAGHSGESVAQFMARVAQAFDELSLATDTLWITHAGVIRAVELIAGGVRQIQHADQWPTAAPAYGQWCKISLSLRVRGAIQGGHVQCNTRTGDGSRIKSEMTGWLKKK